MDNIFYSLEDGCYKTYPDGDEATGNQIREVLEDKENAISKLQQENKQLKDDWNKLKEYIRKTKLKEFEKSYGRRYGKTFTQAEVILCNMITNYMQELEKENDSNE